MLSKSCWLDRRPHARSRRLLVVVTAMAVVWPSTSAFAQAPPGSPGPPPGNGADIPVPPGTAPAFVPPGTAAALPAGASGPGLLSGATVKFNRSKRTFSVPLACQSSGTIRVTARPALSGTVASGRYRCSGGRATPKLKVGRKLAKKLAGKRTVTATATVKGGPLYFVLSTSGSAAGRGFWTDGHLQCTQENGAAQAYLAEPDFTASSPVPISTRGWVAWYTARSGWHWFGVGGENKSRWDTWTATPTGVAQFHPNGTPIPVPWTWGPISVPAGQGIYAIGVYEIVYWVGGKPSYRWQYVNAGTTGAAAAGGGTLYCAYP